MTVRFEQFPNDATLICFHGIHHEWGWSVEQIAFLTATPVDRVRAILDCPDLRQKYATLQRLRARNAKRMLARGIHVETVIWEPSTATAKPAGGAVQREKRGKS